MSVRQMSSKHLIAAVFLVAVCLGVLVFYGWQGEQIAQPGENAESEVENVDLSYLVDHIEEFENKKVRTEGVVQHYDDMVTETVGDFEILGTNASIPVRLKNRTMPIPSDNSFIVVEGTVECVYGFYIAGRYRILADNWTSEISFETISHITYGTHENHEYLVIENSEEWGRVWSFSMPVYHPAPEIDFSTHMVIAVFMGWRSSSGYGISIERITNMGNEIIVNVKETYPGRGVGTLTVVTHPHHIIKVERVEKPIVFEVQQFLSHALDENGNPYDEIMYELVGEHRVELGSGPPEPSI